MHLFPGPERDLHSRHFVMEEDLQSTVTEFFVKQNAEWCSTAIHKLILCNNNCLHEQGDYVKK